MRRAITSGRVSKMALRAARARGFTLLEIMAVVSIIAVLAATTLPGITERLRDRRANEGAQQLSVFYRQARARALGRGAAQLVRFRNAPVTQGELLLYEAVQPQTAAAGSTLGSCGFLPPTASNTCILTAWPSTADNGQTAPAPTATSRFVGGLNLSDPAYQGVFASFMIGQNAAANADICFTPTGRTYLSVGGTPMAPLTTIARLDVIRKVSNSPVGLTRQVLIPPNGATRLIL